MHSTDKLNVFSLQQHHPHNNTLAQSNYKCVATFEEFSVTG